MGQNQTSPFPFQTGAIKSKSIHVAVSISTLFLFQTGAIKNSPKLMVQQTLQQCVHVNTRPNSYRYRARHPHGI